MNHGGALHYYKIAEVVLKSVYSLPSFSAFACECGTADVELGMTQELPLPGTDQESWMIACRRKPEGWFFHWKGDDTRGLYVSSDYTRLALFDETYAEVGGSISWTDQGCNHEHGHEFSLNGSHC